MCQTLHHLQLRSLNRPYKAITSRCLSLVSLEVRVVGPDLIFHLRLYLSSNCSSQFKQRMNRITGRPWFVGWRAVTVWSIVCVSVGRTGLVYVFELCLGAKVQKKELSRVQQVLQIKIQNMPS